MKSKTCSDAKDHVVHKSHKFSTEHGERWCKGWFPAPRSVRPRLLTDEGRELGQP